MTKDFAYVHEVTSDPDIFIFRICNAITFPKTFKDILEVLGSRSVAHIMFSIFSESFIEC